MGLSAIPSISESIKVALDCHVSLTEALLVVVVAHPEQALAVINTSPSTGHLVDTNGSSKGGRLWDLLANCESILLDPKWALHILKATVCALQTLQLDFNF